MSRLAVMLALVAVAASVHDYGSYGSSYGSHYGGYGPYRSHYGHAHYGRKYGAPYGSYGSHGGYGSSYGGYGSYGKYGSHGGYGPHSGYGTYGGYGSRYGHGPHDGHDSHEHHDHHDSHGVSHGVSHEKHGESHGVSHDKHGDKVVHTSHHEVVHEGPAIVDSKYSAVPAAAAAHVDHVAVPEVIEEPLIAKGGPVDLDGGSDRYYLSWVGAPGKKFTWDEADHSCRSLGYRLISIQDAATDNFVSHVLLKDKLEFIWTSGTRVAGTDKFHWGDGSLVYGYTNWSLKGGDGRPQPDNREGHEDCLSVLNNFYGDGVVWHDIACHHRKYFICDKY